MVVIQRKAVMGRPRKPRDSIRRGYFVKIPDKLVRVSRVFHDDQARDNIISGFEVSKTGRELQHVVFSQRLIEKNFETKKTEALDAIPERRGRKPKKQ